MPGNSAPADREPLVAVAFWRGLDIFRPLGAAYAGYLAWHRRGDFVRPWVAVATIAVIGLWSLALIVYRRRTRTLVAAEIVLACAAILATLAAHTPEQVRAGAMTLPTIWVAGSVVGAAILLGARGGLVAAAVVAVADLVEVQRPNSVTVHNIILLFLLGGLIGLCVDLAREGQTRLEGVLAEQERLRERDRLARVVHDGVLQTLAFINRRGHEIGGPTGALAELAAEQERSLRRLVSRTGDTVPVAGTPDLGVRLADLDGPTVHVVVPAQPVRLDSDSVGEIEAAVKAALDNVGQHAGPAAEAWVLLEQSPTSVRVTVRDNGSGADLDHLLSAHDQGRLGVSSSIRGRLEDLGGSAIWSTRPGHGCTVRMELPRRDT